MMQRFAYRRVLPGSLTVLLAAPTCMLQAQLSEQARLLPEGPGIGAMRAFGSGSFGSGSLRAEGLPAPEEAGAAGELGGVVMDPGGAVVSGAKVLVVALGPPAKGMAEMTTDEDGGFRVTDLPSGAYVLRVQAAGFAERQFKAEIREGLDSSALALVLPMAAADAEVSVTVTRQEVAEAQVRQEEKQRVFGAIPNFYVSYEKNPEPLSARQKFQMAWRTLIDPATFVVTGIAAGVEQATNTFDGYGQGAAGYGRRYAASYGDQISGTMLGNAILPSLLKQDPRYFVQGTGTVRSRMMHAISRSVLTRSDRGHREVDYSGLLGGLASAGISNLYYPAEDRNGAGLTFANFGIGIAGSAGQSLFQEFLIKKLSRGVPPVVSAAGAAKGD